MDTANVVRNLKLNAHNLVKWYLNGSDHISKLSIKVPFVNQYIWSSESSSLRNGCFHRLNVFLIRETDILLEMYNFAKITTPFIHISRRFFHHRRCQIYLSISIYLIYILTLGLISHVLYEQSTKQSSCIVITQGIHKSKNRSKRYNKLNIMDHR